MQHIQYLELNQSLTTFKCWYLRTNTTTSSKQQFDMFYLIHTNISYISCNHFKACHTFKLTFYPLGSQCFHFGKICLQKFEFLEVDNPSQ